MARVEAPHVPAHRGDAGLLGDLDQILGVLDAVGDRNLDQHVLAGAHHLLALAEMHLGRRGQDHRVGALDAFREIAGPVLDAVFLRDLRGGVLIAAHQRGDFHALNALQGVEMLLAERALAGDTDFHRTPLRTSILARAAARLILAAGFFPLPAACFLFCKMMCPTAVLEAGTV